VGKSEVRKPLGRPKRRWKDSIKIYLKEIGLGVRTGSGYDGPLAGFLYHDNNFDVT
jgi:hypothetical protein